MTFVWTDRDGVRRDLADGEPILAEWALIEREIDSLVGLVESDDRSMRDLARRRIDAYQLRQDRLLADLDRWNAYATAANRVSADEMIEKIESLPTILTQVLLVVDLHDEHEMLLKETAGDPAARAAASNEPMTALQARAVAACDARSPPASTATRGEIKAWLDGHPQFRRERRSDAGWFAWADHDGHAHRLVDPLAIEIEMTKISGDLAALRPRLVAESDPTKLYALVNKTGASWERMSILQGDLRRFEREAEARDRTECKAWAADWRAKRKATS